MPNWKNRDEYDLPEDMPLRRWAWEFLRRNPVYRLEWTRLFVACGPLIVKHGPFATWLKAPEALKAESDAWENDPWYGTRELLPVALGRAWQLECMVDPEASEAKFLDMPIPPPIWERALDVQPFIGAMEEPSPTGRYTWIRLDAHIEPQLELLGKRLKELQKEHDFVPPALPIARAQTRLYKNYLRVLDGREAGASHHAIAVALESEIKSDDPNKKISDDPDKTIKDQLAINNTG